MKTKNNNEIEREPYEKYLLGKIDKYKFALKGSMPRRIREGLEIELQDYEARLFNYKKGFEKGTQSKQKDVLKILDERLSILKDGCKFRVNNGFEHSICGKWSEHFRKKLNYDINKVWLCKSCVKTIKELEELKKRIEQK